MVVLCDLRIIFAGFVGALSDPRSDRSVWAMFQAYGKCGP